MSARQSIFSNLPDKNIVCDSLINQAITFIWESLIPWRENPDRIYVKGEEELNGQFCVYLNLRAKEKMPMICFHHEDRQKAQRRIDIGVKPSCSVIIHGCRYTFFQSILGIECKRLPTPGTGRTREYVTGEDGKASGAIQRFKLGEHGHEHDVAIVVGYVQKNNPKDWFSTINSWILALSNDQPDIWNEHDLLKNMRCFDAGLRVKSFSKHSRLDGCKSNTIQLHHFWIKM